MKKSTLLLSSFLMGSILVFGQSSRKASPVKFTHLNVNEKTTTAVSDDRCGMLQHEDYLRSTNPNYDAIKAQGMLDMEEAIKNMANSPEKGAVYTLPTVVHVVYNTAAQNLSDAQIQNMMDLLNADFRRTNSDAGNTPSAFQGLAADMEIQFCLASTDPNGQPTTGIIHKSTSVTSFSTNDAVKFDAQGGSTAWPTDKYFNIWVCNMGGGILGYGEFPTPGLSNTYGAVSHYCTVPGPNACAPYNQNRTMTHELSHCFNLYHTWGDDGGACSGSDQVADTPNQADATYGCKAFPATDACTPSGDGIMFMNFMDYSDDNCMNMFTVGQRDRAKAAVQTYLSSVYNNTAACSAAAINAEFTGNPLVINEGMSVTFTDASTSPDVLNSWVWSFPGGTPNSFTGQTPPAITYNTAGQYDVTLTIGDNNGGSDVATKAMYVTVNPAGTAICDSMAAGWDWNTESFGGAYWTQDAAACNLPLEGYIVGNNCYDDNGWASRVTHPGANMELVEVRYVFVQSTGTGGASLKVWDGDGAASAPNTVLASAPVTTGQFSGQLNGFIQLPISPAIDLDVTGNDFYIGYDHDVTPIDGDSIVMGVATAATNTTWANEVGGWKDLGDYGVTYKGSVVAVVCNKTTGVKSVVGGLEGVTAFPNPSTGTVEVMLPRNNAAVTVFNMVGEQVLNSSTTSNMLTLDLGNQPNGVYFIKVTSEGETVTKKVLLSK